MDGSATTTLIDGTTVRIVPTPELLAGMFAPLTNGDYHYADGLVRTRTQTRTGTLAADGSTTITESLNENGRISSRSFTSANRTWTVTSAEARTSHIVLDGLARVISTDTAGTLPRTYRYDTQGRVDRIAQSSTRFRDFIFDPTSGYLQTTTDALSQSDDVTAKAGPVTLVIRPRLSLA